MMTSMRRFRPGVAVLAGWTLAAIGCGNPEEGTITVSPEARARLRGGATPEQAEAKPKGKGPKIKAPVDPRDLNRKRTEQGGQD